MDSGKNSNVTSNGEEISGIHQVIFPDQLEINIYNWLLSIL